MPMEYFHFCEFLDYRLELSENAFDARPIRQPPYINAITSRLTPDDFSIAPIKAGVLEDARHGFQKKYYA